MVSIEIATAEDRVRILQLVIGAIIVAGVSLPSGPIRAAENRVAARLIEAYGGAKSVNLLSLTGTNQRLVTTDIRTASPGAEETAYRIESFVLDIRNRHATNEFVLITPARTAHRQRIYDGT